MKVERSDGRAAKCEIASEAKRTRSTDMEFVLHVLEYSFNKGREEATRIMLQVHNKGAGVCAVYAHQVAEDKAAQVMEFSRKHKHPLQCIMERR
jgi:ATP-dependent Clp protease adaptor protein ClpS